MTRSAILAASSRVAADGAVTEYRYVVAWKRVDGRWKLHRDIWN